MPYAAVLSALAVALLTIIGIAWSGHFQIYNVQGILSGPFSALLLLGALVAAAFILIYLDWKVWLPERIERAKKIRIWLSQKVLGCEDSPSPDWKTLIGTFAGRQIKLARTAGGAMWRVQTMAPLEFLIVRQPNKERTKSEAGEFVTGDVDFDECYQWQAQSPQSLISAFKTSEVRMILKQLATLIAPHGTIGSAQAGLRVGGGEICVYQMPAPWLRGGEAAAEEVLFILNNLCMLAERLEGDPGKAAASKEESAAVRSDALPLWALLFGGICLIALWLLGTWLLAKLFGMSAAMVGFFIPPLMLALTFMYSSANSTGRDQELEEFLEKEAHSLVQRRIDLKQILARL